MSWRDALAMALRSATRRLGRTALTVLAVALASALLVALATIVVTANSRVIRQVSKGGPITGVKVLAAEAAPGQLETDQFRAGRPLDIDREMLERIRDLPGVASVAPVLTAEVLAIPPLVPDGPRAIFERAVGVDLSRIEDLPVSVLAGRLPSPDSTTEVAVTQGYLDRLHLDVERPDRVLGTELVIGAPQVFRSGDEIRYRGRWVRMSVVGVVAQDAATGQFLVPLHETQADRDWALGGIADGDRFRLPTSEYSGLIVVASSLDRVHQVRADIADLGYATSAPEQLIANVQRYLHVVDIVLAGIAGIALVIASLGIASAMLAAVRERRREIGVLKAIGARDRDVRRWFLIEAGFVGTLGGAIGTLAGTVVAALVGAVVNRYLTSQGLEGVRMLVPFAVLALGVGGSALLALLAGLAPARRAARLPSREAVGGL